MASESIAHSAFGLMTWAIDSESIRAQGIIVNETVFHHYTLNAMAESMKCSQVSRCLILKWDI